MTANVGDTAVARAASILGSFDMVNIGKRAGDLARKASSRRQRPPHLKQATSAVASSIAAVPKQVPVAAKVPPKEVALTDAARNDNVLEVIEEDLAVGKEQVERGRMRIYNVVTEREVAQNIALKDETLRVQRRPINRAVEFSPDLFKARQFEMVEIDEIAQVKKTARVVEEVTLGKEVTDKIETIKETLRRQDVQVEEIPAVRPFDAYGDEFKKLLHEAAVEHRRDVRKSRARISFRTQSGHARAVPQQPVDGGRGRCRPHLGGEEPRDVEPEQGRSQVRVGECAQRSLSARHSQTFIRERSLQHGRESSQSAGERILRRTRSRKSLLLQGRLPPTRRLRSGTPFRPFWAGLTKSSQTAQGATDLFGMLQRGGFDGATFRSLGSLLRSGSGVSDALKVGAPLVSSLFGTRQTGLTDWIASAAGIRPQSSASLLGIAMPFVLGLVSREATAAGGFNASSIGKLLGRQGEFLRSVAPPGLATLLGVSDWDEPARAYERGEPARAYSPPVRPPAVVYDRPRGFGWLKWALPLLLLPLLILGASPDCAPESRDGRSSARVGRPRW